MPRSVIALFGALALLIASCGDDDDSAAGTTTTSEAPTSSDPTTTTTTGPTDGWERCENPEGFSIEYPSDWATNDGTVTERCGLFDPDPFDVPDATDARVAAVSAYVDAVPFDDVEDGLADDVTATTTAVDGQRALRTEGPAGELYGDDVRRTAYIVDLPTPNDDAERTLFVDVVEADGVDYDAAVAVLDRMMTTIDLDLTEQSSRG